MIMRNYLEDYGYTPGCHKCKGIQDGDRRTIAYSHSVQCRNRIKECLARDSVRGSEPVGEAIQRQNEFLAKEVEMEEDKSGEGKRARIGIDFEETPKNAMDESGPTSSTTTSSSSGSTEAERPKRVREEGEGTEENERPTHYQATEEEEQKKPDVPMQNNLMNTTKRRGGT